MINSVIEALLRGKKKPALDIPEGSTAALLNEDDAKSGALPGITADKRRAMSALLVGGGVDLAEVGQMFARLTENHQKRMALMGLTA